MTKIKIPLLRFAYLNYRNVKCNKDICVMNGGKMPEEEYNRTDIQQALKELNKDNKTEPKEFIETQTIVNNGNFNCQND